MAKTDNLIDFLTDVANAIREKKGTTGAINPQDFSSEIASIESGGGSSESELDSQMTYFDVREGQGDGDAQIMLKMCAEIFSGTIFGLPAAGMPFSLSEGADIKYIGVNLDRAVYMAMDGTTQSKTIKDTILDNVTEEQFNSVRKVTKEEFYSTDV